MEEIQSAAAKHAVMNNLANTKSHLNDFSNCGTAAVVWLALTIGDVGVFGVLPAALGLRGTQVVLMAVICTARAGLGFTASKTKQTLSNLSEPKGAQAAGLLVSAALVFAAMTGTDYFRGKMLGANLDTLEALLCLLALKAILMTLRRAPAECC